MHGPLQTGVSAVPCANRHTLAATPPLTAHCLPLVGVSCLVCSDTSCPYCRCITAVPQVSTT
jgi:hypothetical protein